MDFVTKSFRKDETLTSWTLSQRICPHFWAWLLNTIAITPKSEDKYVVKVFNSSEFHLSEMACYKIHTLTTIYLTLSTHFHCYTISCVSPSVNCKLPKCFRHLSKSMHHNLWSIFVKCSFELCTKAWNNEGLWLGAIQ